MSWSYEQATGALAAPDGTLAGTGYSGHGAGLNNPAAEQEIGVGPIPIGGYTIGPFFDDPGGKGPLVAHLKPDEENVMFGRSGFMIHGDNPQMDHTASDGCIILAHELRQEIAASGDNRLLVTW